MPLSCRFYKHKFPECDELVMVNVRQIAEMGSYVSLLEYNKIEGLYFKKMAKNTPTEDTAVDIYNDCLTI
jgi:hypothetical protein